MNARETKTKIKEKMYAVIDFIECHEAVQISVDNNYINWYSNRLHNMFCGNVKTFINSWYNLLMNEFNELQIGAITKSNIILKINNCAA